MRTQEGRDRPDGGKYPDKCILTVLVGDRTYQVEYRDERAAENALGGEPDPMEVVSIPVGVRSAKGFTFYFGRTGGN